MEISLSKFMNTKVISNYTKKSQRIIMTKHDVITNDNNLVGVQRTKVINVKFRLINVKLIIIYRVKLI